MFSRNYYRTCGCNNDNDENDNSIYDNSCGNYSNEEYMSDDCACGYSEPYDVFPSSPMLAESYVPTQQLNNVFKNCIGLKNGTMYPELVSEYCPGQSMEEIAYLRNTNKIKEGCNQCQQ